LRSLASRIAKSGHSRLTEWHKNIGREQAEDRGESVRQLSLATLFLALSSFSALAADITVYAPNIVAGPLRKLAETWTAETGNKVTFAGFNVGRVRTAVEKNDPGDIVVAPTGNFAEFAPKLKAGSERPLGRILFGVVVKAGGAHPDISSREKFVAFVKKAVCWLMPIPRWAA
jgi:hypothetical protein